MREPLQDRATKTVELARAAGADDVWAAAERQRRVSFQVRNGELEEVTDSTGRSLSLRLYVAGRYSAHSTTDLRPDRLQAFVAEAVALTRALEPDEHRVITDPALYAGRTSADLKLVDPRIQKLAREQRVDWCKELNAPVAGKRHVISAESGVSDVHTVVVAASSNGFLGHYEATSVSTWASAALDDGDKRPEDYDICTVRNLDGLRPPADVATRALELAYAHMGSTKGPTARTTVVVDNRAAGRLIGRLLQPADARAIQQDKSFWTNKLGKQLVSKALTITDDPLIPGGLGSRPFDSEGIAAKKRTIIAGGALRTLFADTYYARKLGIAPTTGDASNLVIGLGARNRDAILKAVGKGVYATSWLGGNMDASTGDFSFGMRGHLIENGTLGAPVAELNVTGNIAQLFANLQEVGNDPYPYSSLLAPTLVFSDVQLSGA